MLRVSLAALYIPILRGQARDDPSPCNRHAELRSYLTMSPTIDISYEARTRLARLLVASPAKCRNAFSSGRREVTAVPLSKIAIKTR
jgi:hypothetical protein